MTIKRLAAAIENADFFATWAREDGPVAAGAVSRTWLWGPEPFTAELEEPYQGAAGGVRTVQYFDKARMEINDPQEARNRWYVTTGLLALELVTGAQQAGDTLSVQRGPALIPIAGDPDDPNGPTYASFNWVRGATPFNSGATLAATIDRAGNVAQNQAFASYSVRAEQFVPETEHTVASVFWEYLNTTGLVDEAGTQTTGRLFEPWFYATGFPVTEAYWANVKVGGVQLDVLIQVFERRVLTYTPANDPAWRVELGNVGRHYYNWRYERDKSIPMAIGEPLWRPDLSTLESADGDGWRMGWDVELGSYVISDEGTTEPGALRMVSRHWDGVEGYGPLADYQVAVDVQMPGAGEVGLGVRVGVDNDALTSMVYFGVTASGLRTLTFEDNVASQSTVLLPPATGLATWDSAPGAWNTMTLSVLANRVWASIGGAVVGVVDLPGELPANGGVALVVTTAGASDNARSAGFRNLTVHAVASQ